MADFADIYSKTYTTFGGADIVAVFNNKPIGELQAITFNVTREKAPVYTMGSPDPRSFSRGKRGIAGSMVFAIFNKDSLVSNMREYFTGAHSERHQVLRANVRDWARSMLNLSPDQRYAGLSIDQWNNLLTRDIAQDDPSTQSVVVNNTAWTNPQDEKYIIEYADQIPPFNISLIGNNEYGNRFKLQFFGVEILNESMGFSVDDITTEKAYTFVCRGINGPTDIV